METGAAMQSYNSELLSGLHELRFACCSIVCMLINFSNRDKREALNRSILREEKAKADLQKKISSLNEQLQHVNSSLSQKLQTREEMDGTIREVEAAYLKVQLCSCYSILCCVDRFWKALSPC